MLNSHRSLSSSIKKPDMQTDIMNQIYKYRAIHPLKVAQPGKGKSSSKAGEKNPLKYSVNYFKLPKKGLSIQNIHLT